MVLTFRKQFAIKRPPRDSVKFLKHPAKTLASKSFVSLPLALTRPLLVDVDTLDEFTAAFAEHRGADQADYRQDVSA
jgi:hypothetical protein